jgi:RimJ/RimL family protein N-acetyltransferase
VILIFYNKRGFFMEIQIRKVKPEDAQSLLLMMKQISEETPFLSREPEEWNFGLTDEISIISDILKDENAEWFVAVDNGKIVGISTIRSLRDLSRLKHRATIGLCILKEYWGNGIGGKFIDTCIEWAKEHKIEQLELEVTATNARAKMLYKRYEFEEIYTIPRAMKYKDGSYVNIIGMMKIL